MSNPIPVSYTHLRAGLIQLNPDGTVRDYQAMCKSTGASCQVWLKDPANRDVWQKTRDVLQAAADEGAYGIERIWTVEETRHEEHLDGGFSFVLETNGVYSFGNDWQGQVIRGVDTRDDKLDVYKRQEDFMAGKLPFCFNSSGSLDDAVTKSEGVFTLGVDMLPGKLQDDGSIYRRVYTGGSNLMLAIFKKRQNKARLPD